MIAQILQNLDMADVNNVLIYMSSNKRDILLKIEKNVMSWPLNQRKGESRTTFVDHAEE